MQGIEKMISKANEEIKQSLSHKHYASLRLGRASKELAEATVRFVEQGMSVETLEHFGSLVANAMQAVKEASVEVESKRQYLRGLEDSRDEA